MIDSFADWLADTSLVHLLTDKPELFIFWWVGVFLLVPLAAYLANHHPHLPHHHRAKHKLRKH